VQAVFAIFFVFFGAFFSLYICESSFAVFGGGVSGLFGALLGRGGAGVVRWLERFCLFCRFLGRGGGAWMCVVFGICYLLVWLLVGF